MPEASFNDAELEAALEALSEPGRFREAEQRVARVAPQLQRMLNAALHEGGWFGAAHESQVREAAGAEEEAERAVAIRSLLAEETRMGMLVGVAVGWELARELNTAPTSSTQRSEDMPDVEFQSNGGTAPGYLALPDSGSGPGVVVLQEWWGLDDSVKRMADSFAEEGFVALAPDLFRGETTEQPDEAEQKMMAMNMDETEKDLRGAVDYLSEHESYDGSGIGAVGFCLGGGLAVWAGTANPKVDAVVAYYYVMPHGKPDFSKLDAPVLGHFGDSDDFVPVDDAKALESEIDEASDHHVEFVFYDGAGHAFANDHNRLGTYHSEHAHTAWQGTVDFLKKTFRRS